MELKGTDAEQEKITHLTSDFLDPLSLDGNGCCTLYISSQMPPLCLFVSCCVCFIMHFTVHAAFVHIELMMMITVVWRSGNSVGHINNVTVRRARLVLGWVTIFWQVNHLSISPSHPGQLSLLPSVGRETSISQCGAVLRLASKGRMVHSTCG